MSERHNEAKKRQREEAAEKSAFPQALPSTDVSQETRQRLGY